MYNAWLRPGFNAVKESGIKPRARKWYRAQGFKAGHIPGHRDRQEPVLQ